ncbi:MAG: HAD-IA family hydrolase [Myxococcota bacterium]|nr:HAD-IA family hydrolase [Myxococcota bacterium]
MTGKDLVHRKNKPRIRSAREYRICRIGLQRLARLARGLQALAFTVRPEVLAIAKRVSERRPTGILTNNAPLLEEALPIHFPELVDTFDPILFSFQFGHVKPERAIFEAVQAHLGVPASEILLLDDTAGHVAAASASGWDTIHYQSASQLRNSLASRSLIGEAV